MAAWRRAGMGGTHEDPAAHITLHCITPCSQRCDNLALPALHPLHSPGSYTAYGSVYDDGGYTMTQARRAELLSLGFPDDGYDYLRHVKDLGPKHRPPRRTVGFVGNGRGFEEVTELSLDYCSTAAHEGPGLGLRLPAAHEGSGPQAQVNQALGKGYG